MGSSLPCKSLQYDLCSAAPEPVPHDAPAPPHASGVRVGVNCLESLGMSLSMSFHTGLVTQQQVVTAAALRSSLGVYTAFALPSFSDMCVGSQGHS